MCKKTLKEIETHYDAVAQDVLDVVWDVLRSHKIHDIDLMNDIHAAVRKQELIRFHNAPPDI